MRRSAALLSLPALFLLPTTPASAACVSTTGITVCPPVYTCGPGSVVSLTVAGVGGSGTASCGGATASCTAFRVGCTDVATATSYGTLTCSATSTARVVATCTTTLTQR